MRKNCYGFVKKVLTFFMVLSLIVISTGTEAFASDLEENNGFEMNHDDIKMPSNGIFDIKIITVDSIQEQPFKEIDNGSVVFNNNYASKPYNSDWDKYSTNYYYNQLSERKRIVWDRLDALALSYLDGTNKNNDFESYEYSRNGNTYSAFVLGQLNCMYNQLGNEESVFANDTELEQFYKMFKFSNPQYYFLKNECLWSPDYKNLYPVVYSSFVNHLDRSEATETIKTEINSWVDAVRNQTIEGDVLPIARDAHDIIKENVSYNDNVVADNSEGGAGVSDAEDEQYVTQSVYSALVLYKPICVGYSLAYAMLCNALNLDAVILTSSNHMWNAVRANDSWYNVDCTWDDNGVNKYTYFMVSDTDFDSISSGSRESHVCENMWIGYKPICTQNIGSTRERSGVVFPAPSGVVNNPRFSVKKNGSDYDITIADSTSGASIYYTIDGTMPSVARTKSYMYSSGQTIKVKDYSKVRAIAVKDTFYDSDVVRANFGENGQTVEEGEIILNNFDYIIDGSNIILENYIGNSDSINIPNKIMLNGRVYKVKMPNDCSNYFANTTLKSISFGTLDICNVTNMEGMFSYCSNLSYVDLGDFDTSNVTNMRGMFLDCYELKNLDVTGFDTSKVTDMSEMFSDCYELKNLDVTGFDTSNVTCMEKMFYRCSSLQGIDASNFDTSNVTSMSQMFCGCSGLKSIDVSNFDTSNVAYMSGMFSYCWDLQSLDVSNFDTSNVADMGDMFYACTSLQSLDVSGFDTSNVTDMGGVFDGCEGLQSLDVSNFDTRNVTNMSEMFSSCINLVDLDVTGFNTSNVTDMAGMFAACRGLQSLDVSNFDTSNVTNMDRMFSCCNELKDLDVTVFDTSNVTDMGEMFEYCYGLQSLDVSGFDTSNVTYMRHMFAGCKGLQAIDVSGFDTSNVTNMYGMFEGCTNLQSLNLRRFNTSNVTDMGEMFKCCYGLQSLDVSGFDTSNVIDMLYMFCGCSSLQSLDLSGFDTDNATDMSHMFDGCSSLQSLDLSNFNTGNVADMSGMFWSCFCLNEIMIPLNVQQDVTPELPYTFVRKDNKSVEYMSLPVNQTTSFSIVKKQEEPVSQPDPEQQPQPNPQPDPAQQPDQGGTVNKAGETFKTDENGSVRCYNKDGSAVINQFKCDDKYTYFFQADGTAMTDRLSYHPDGQHVIYFDSQGHEVFSNFANVKKTISGDAVNDFCFFDTFGYLYVDVLTYDKAGQNIYYANPYGVMEVNKWFQFSNNVKWADGTQANGHKNQYGYAQYDGTLLRNSWTYDWEGRWCYMQGNGVALY